MSRAGVYVPGGLVTYPSSVLMNVVPAQVAGVPQIAVASPPQENGLPSPAVLAACALLGIEEVHAAGGAQAIAMLGYGTAECAAVDTITGPGNIYVAAAKRLLLGTISTDAEAGPTEIAIIADDTADPEFVAADLIAQAEHDPLAACLLITTDPGLADRVDKALGPQIAAARHRERVEAALAGQSACVLVDDADAALATSDAWAPEHLEIQAQDAGALARRVRNAGAIFVGPYAPVSLGDYLAGSNPSGSRMVPPGSGWRPRVWRLRPPKKKQDFYRAVDIALEGAQDFIRRYAALASGKVGRIAGKLAESPAETFHEAVQSVWLLFALLHAESNASSFLAGRLDQYLCPYLEQDLQRDVISLPEALEILECLLAEVQRDRLHAEFGECALLCRLPYRIQHCHRGPARGRKRRDEPALLAVPESAGAPAATPAEPIRPPAPRLTSGIPARSRACHRHGQRYAPGLQRRRLIPALQGLGIRERDARDYAVVGCVELSTQGNNLGWSGAAMLNMVKVLELTLSGGVCLLSGQRIGLDTGTLADCESFEQLEGAYERQLDHFIDLTISACDTVDRAHAELFPSPFLSRVIDDCVDQGVDVTAEGATYNLSEIRVSR